LQLFLTAKNFLWFWVLDGWLLLLGSCSCNRSNSQKAKKTAATTARKAKKLKAMQSLLLLTAVFNFLSTIKHGSVAAIASKAKKLKAVQSLLSLTVFCYFDLP
jgi:hypothetical protein